MMAMDDEPSFGFQLFDARDVHEIQARSIHRRPSDKRPRQSDSAIARARCQMSSSLRGPSIRDIERALAYAASQQPKLRLARSIHADNAPSHCRVVAHLIPPASQPCGSPLRKWR